MSNPPLVGRRRQTACLYIYVSDVGVEDGWGNVWQIATRRSRMLGWIALGGPIITIFSFAFLAVLQWKR